MNKNRILQIVLFLALVTVGKAATLLDIGTTAPGTNLILSNPQVTSPGNAAWKKQTAAPALDRKEVQSFLAPGNSSSSFSLSSIVFLDPAVNSLLAGNGFTISLISLSTTALGTPTAAEYASPLYSESGTTPALSTAAGDYLSFSLDTPWTLTGGQYYGIVLSWGSGVTFAQLNLQMTKAVSGVSGTMFTSADNGATFTDNYNSAVFYLVGQAVPEPGAVKMIMLGGVLLGIVGGRRRWFSQAKALS